MSKRRFITTITFLVFFVLLLSWPKDFLNATACLTAGNCCTVNAASCADIGLSRFSEGAGDVACQTQWGSTVGKVCCVGGRLSGQYGRCAADVIIGQTASDATSQTVTQAETRALPTFSSLIKLERTTVIGNIIKSLLGLTGTVTVIMMVYGGLLWMTAAGNEKAVSKAKQIILWTAIGLVLIFSSYTILNFLFSSLRA